jgi:hypothetical protein
MARRTTNADVNARKKVLERIKRIEEGLTKAREYLESDKHANWSVFRPLFVGKVVSGNAAPPHKDWVKNVFIPRRERALRYAEKILQRLDENDG